MKHSHHADKFSKKIKQKQFISITVSIQKKMQKNILKITSAAALLILMSACSQKSTEASSTQQQARPEARQGQRSGGAPQFSELLSQMDKNKDGKLAKAEVEGPLKNDFSKVDQDNDGFISETEFKKAPPPQRQRGGQ